MRDRLYLARITPMEGRPGPNSNQRSTDQAKHSGKPRKEQGYDPLFNRKPAREENTSLTARPQIVEAVKKYLLENPREQPKNMKTCPECSIINQPSAERCDCGYSFATNSIPEKSLSSERRRPFLGWTLLITGIVLIGY